MEKQIAKAAETAQLENHHGNTVAWVATDADYHYVWTIKIPANLVALIEDRQILIDATDWKNPSEMWPRR